MYLQMHISNFMFQSSGNFPRWVCAFVRESKCPVKISHFLRIVILRCTYTTATTANAHNLSTLAWKTRSFLRLCLLIILTLWNRKPTSFLHDTCKKRRKRVHRQSSNVPNIQSQTIYTRHMKTSLHQRIIIPRMVLAQEWVNPCESFMWRSAKKLQRNT